LEIKNVTMAISATTPRVVPTDAATMVEVGIELELELSGDGYPASTAALVAMRSYKHAGIDGVVFDMTHRTSLLVVSQLKTF
jgi:hypothetical protein